VDERKSFGARFDPITYGDLEREILRCAASRETIHVGYMNLHGAFLYQRDSRFREFFDTARMVYADGFPIMAWRRILWGDVTPDMRFTLIHILPTFLAFCRNHGLSVYYVGSEPAVVRAGIEHFTREIPGLKLDGCSGYFDMTIHSSATLSVLRRIESFKPDIVLLGMGMPRQEIWAMENRSSIAAPVVYTCGAAIEYYSGLAALPPAWLGPLGLTWLFRLVHDPRKLWFRYLVEPVMLFPRALSELGSRMTKTK
jgi:N-acetylglucosaminyldiphosphoundecaprenol N-acetyl-beta-D-mannosaminyltransferase